MHNALTDVPGFLVGHWTDRDAATGCSVVLCPPGTLGGVDVRGGAPGTRELALLDPLCMMEEVHAVLLSGGSAFGLDAASGVVRWLEARGVGYDVGIARVPIVPAAILFDLGIGRADVRPDAAAGYAACEAAHAGPVAEGCVGAGTGATVGKLLGPHRAMKGGIGSASRRLTRGLVIGALAAVNALGDVRDPDTAQIVAGARRADGEFVGDMLARGSRLGRSFRDLALRRLSGENTTLAVVATNAKLTKAGATKVAQMAHDGLARSIRPVHTLRDGDTVFTLACGQRPTQAADPDLVGAVAADVLCEAVLRAVRAADSLHGIPAAAEIERRKATEDRTQIGPDRA